jgi:hypothetical protein
MVRFTVNALIVLTLLCCGVAAQDEEILGDGTVYGDRLSVDSTKVRIDGGFDHTWLGVGPFGGLGVAADIVYLVVPHLGVRVQTATGATLVGSYWAFVAGIAPLATWKNGIELQPSVSYFRGGIDYNSLLARPGSFGGFEGAITFRKYWRSGGLFVCAGIRYSTATEYRPLFPVTVGFSARL